MVMMKKREKRRRKFDSMWCLSSPDFLERLYLKKLEVLEIILILSFKWTFVYCSLSRSEESPHPNAQPMGKHHRVDLQVVGQVILWSALVKTFQT